MSHGIEAADRSARAHLQSLQDDLGHEHPELEAPIARLAELSRVQGKMLVARAFMRRLVHLRVVLYGADHPVVARTRGELEALGDEPSRGSQWTASVVLNG